MKTDVTHLLREANPVIDQAPYPEAELRRRIDAITGAPTTSEPGDATVIALVDRPPVVARRRRLLAGVAAASVAVVATASVTIAHEHSTSSPGSGGTTTSCVVSANPSSTLSRAVRTVITDRVTARGGHAVAIRLNGKTISFTAPGVDARTAAAACAPTTVALRPLVIAPVAVSTTGTHTATPLTGLGFAVPRDATQVTMLRPSQRTRLMTAMARYDCAAGGSVAPVAPALVCGGSTGRPLVYLLGPAVAISSGVGSATALAPGQSPGGTQWTVRLTFTPTGQVAVSEYTDRHHTTRTGPTATACAPTSSPCADFLAAVINNRVASAAQINAPINGVMDTTGGFDQSAATTLADDVTAASIGLRPATR